MTYIAIPCGAEYDVHSHVGLEALIEFKKKERKKKSCRSVHCSSKIWQHFTQQFVKTMHLTTALCLDE